MLIAYKKGLGNFADDTKSKVEARLQKLARECVTLESFMSRVKKAFRVGDSYIGDYYGYMYITYNCILFAVDFDYMFNIDIY